jgi:RNA polymerase sigma factor (sigma-70 family)
MEATRDGHGWIMAAVDAHEQPLVRYARRLLGDVDLAADAELEEESIAPAAEHAAGRDPATTAERRELAARLRDLLRDLPPPQREAIDLWCEGFTAKEIAAITGRTEGHVRVLTHRGLTALRTHPLIRGLIATAPSVTSST